MGDKNISASSAHMKIPWTKGKSSGWTAFDLKQRQKQGLGPEINEDAFPSMPSSFTTLDTREKLKRNYNLSVKSFSSALMSPLDFPALADNKDCRNQVMGSSSSSNEKNLIVQDNSHDLALKKVKEMNSWADDSLIKDILLATDDNVEMASVFLRGMVSHSSSEENKHTRNEERSSKTDDLPCNRNRVENTPVGKTPSTSSGKTASYRNKDALMGGLQDKECSHVNVSDTNELFQEAPDLKMIIGHLNSIPIEPEWEEDDVYLSHRMDALKMMRSASHHSKAAANAFMRGDHSSAQQHSMKARENWLVAERLNAEAAKEILCIRNSNNDMWKLDLHGLHATEAVQALQERLQRIESQVTVNRSVSPNRLKGNNRILRTSSHDSFSNMDVEKVNSQRMSFRQRQTSLQVITGIGNHSRGQASLPIAVKSFLEDNRYQYDETRPGVITVRPKFCHR